MRAAIPALLLLLSCSTPARAPLAVPVRVACQSGDQWGVGEAHGSTVTTATHVLRCADGLPRLSITAGGEPVTVEGYDAVLATLRAEGAPWGEAPVVRRVGPGDSGTPLFDSRGRLVGYLQAVDGTGGIITLARDPGLVRERVRVEGPPTPTLDLDPPYGPDGCWPECEP